MAGKNSQFKKGMTPWNKGKKGVYSAESLKKMSESTKGQIGYWKGKKRPPVSEQQKEKMRLWRKTQVMTVEHRRKISESRRGEKNHQWKGGVEKESKVIRKSFEYKLWRTAVFERDNFTCVFCGVKGGELHADHIKPFALYPELRFAIDNGRTLCVPCHKTTDTYGYQLIYKKNEKN